MIKILEEKYIFLVKFVCSQQYIVFILNIKKIFFLIKTSDNYKIF